ncbi:MAG: hypothetical protein IJX90_07980 [Blautia sp.]|nr:hypothetical protein [Blautia sp.]
MTALEYVRAELRKEYGSKAAIIETWLENRLAKMMDQHELTEEERQSAFQVLLNEMLYPFIACFGAMKDAEIPLAEVNEFCRRIWDQMPEEMKQEIVRRDTDIIK